MMERTLELEHTTVFTQNWQALKNEEHRFIINQGGSRSSKTYSLCQVVIMYALTNPGKHISIVRKSFPALRESVMKDFFDIMRELDIYDEKCHHKTRHVYSFQNKSEVEFFSIDDEQKLRGRKRDVLMCNEGNELKFEEWNQLVMRTKGKVFVDFNPSDTDHWIYELLKNPKAILIKSNYLDNPFLEREQVEYIEQLINVDENWYKIYALGERPTSTSRIYSHFQQFVDYVPSNDFAYGFDHGFNHPSALVECRFIEDRVYVREMIYESKLTTPDLVQRMKDLNIDRTRSIYCDSARPEVIEELRRAGYTRAVPADKSVKAGIDRVKSKQVLIHHESLNLIKESKLYSWKVDGDRVLDEPIKLNDDGMDALRYCVYNHSRQVARTPFRI